MLTDTSICTGETLELSTAFRLETEAGSARFANPDTERVLSFHLRHDKMCLDFFSQRKTKASEWDKHAKADM